MKTKVFRIVTDWHTFTQIPFAVAILGTFPIETTESKILVNESEYSEVKEACSSLWIEIEEEIHYKDWSFRINNNRLEVI